MATMMHSIFAIWFSLLLGSVCGAGLTPTVKISTGTLIGSAEEFSHKAVGTRTLHVYRGIPYAEPPVGDLRFAPPKPKTPWEGEYDATHFRTACLQPTFPLVPIDKIQNEDCLHLNVYVPTSESTTGPKPVMLWIHGGGFTVGSGTMMYDATILSSVNDVIVVTINYRLGVFGFFSTGDDVAPGNYGLLDQLEALRWVQKNIAAFGGDPDTVTIFGESAGSMSAHLQILSPLSEGLFKRVIMQSGTANFEVIVRVDTSIAPKVAHGLGKIVGCEKDNTKDLLDCLRTVPADKLTNTADPQTGALANATGITDLIFPYAIIIDGKFLTESPFDILRDKTFNKVDIMIGTMAAEGILFLLQMFADSEDVSLNKTMYDAIYPSMILGKHSQAVTDVTRLIYVDWEHADDENADYVDAVSQMAGDQMMVCPSDLVARAHFTAGCNTYLYQMTHVPVDTIWPVKTGRAVHGDDIQFVFGHTLISEEKQVVLGGDDSSVFKASGVEEEENLALQVMKYWTNFAKTGNPNLSSPDDDINNDDWPLFTVPELSYKILTPLMENGRALKARECAFWNDFVPKHPQSSDACDVKEDSKYSEEVNKP